MYIKRHVKHITKQNGIDETAMALHVENLARRDRRRGGGQTNAQRVGIRRGDIIVGFGERNRPAFRKWCYRLCVTRTSTSKIFAGEIAA